MLLYISIIVFNLIAIKINKIPTMNRIVHIWLFTIAFQFLFDIIVEFKYHAYWYFEKGIDFKGMPAHFILIPPVNIILLSFFPFKSTFFKQAMYIICWTLGIIIYEAVTSIPAPWGFFHYGWWKLWYDIIIVPILILILLGYYKWISKLEAKISESNKN
ncbi:hypothetical protein P5G62_009710 [Neobacillus sp. 179-C4.2 HS]|uniref:Uncharacterized protein n=1 Tax=Neobacillus driksii TaxID=3035913 RepID=A0ABV4YRA7_9BACI|nr:hypothetical protein [Neobacillus sp. 179.-C4.2 HS]